MSRFLSFKFYIKIQWSVCRSSFEVSGWISICTPAVQAATPSCKLQSRVSAPPCNMQFQGSRFTSECSSSFQNAAPSVKIHIMIQLQVSKFRSEPGDAGHDRAKGFRCDLKFQDSHQDSAHLSKLQFQVARFTIKVQLHVSTCSYKLQVTRVASRSSSAFLNAVARFLLHTRIKLQVPRCSSEVQDSCSDPAQCFQMQLKA